MRLSIIASVAVLASCCSAARACGPAVECLPRAVTFPAYTPEGLFLGTVASPVRTPYPLEPSRYTGQPVTVVFNDPERSPESVVPDVALLPLPRVGRFHTQAVYPRGY